MSFQAVIGPKALKPFTRALICLSRFGDDVVIQASPDALILTATNSAKSAFCKVKLGSNYFDKYKLEEFRQPGSTFQTPPEVEGDRVKGQLLVKSLLSILKHKTIEKTVDRCDLSIIEGGQEPDQTADVDKENLENKVVIRLHCKHGVVKTHRLLLLTPRDLHGPNITFSPAESRVTIGPATLKDILDHFPHAKGTKGDPQLGWSFSANEVKVKSMQFGNKEGSQISTEIMINADEFESYSVYDPPISFAFFLREFNATIALAESLSVSLDLRFTESTAPIYIEFDADSSDSEFFFVISTSHSETPLSPKMSGAANLRKRDREKDPDQEALEDESSGKRAIKKSLRAAVRELPSVVPQARPRQSGPISQQMASQDGPVNENTSSGSGDAPSVSGAPERLSGKEPLFMPGTSQLSNADLDFLRGSGLGIEHMDYEEFEAMMEAEGEEVGMSTAVRDEPGNTAGVENQDWEAAGAETDDDQQIGPSQAPFERRGDKEFRPLFDD